MRDSLWLQHSDFIKQAKSGPVPVSYTHLDVYKRQALSLAAFELRYHQSLILLENSPVFYLKGINAAYNTWYTLR